MAWAAVTIHAQMVAGDPEFSSPKSSEKQRQIAEKTALWLVGKKIFVLHVVSMCSLKSSKPA